MNVKFVLLVLILYDMLSNLYIVLVTSLELWNNFQEKLADRKWLFPLLLLSQQRYSSSLYFWECMSLLWR